MSNGYVPDHVPVTGMMTVCKDEAAAFASRLGLTDGGHAILTVVLVGVVNPRDGRPSLAVTHEGSTIGYLWSRFEGNEFVIAGSVREAPMQVFARQGREHLRLLAHVWLGEGEPDWRFDADSRPPMNASEQAEDRLKGALERIARDKSRDPHWLERVRAGQERDSAFVPLNTVLGAAAAAGDLDEAWFIATLIMEGVSRHPRRRAAVMRPSIYAVQDAFRVLALDSDRLAVIEWWISVDPEDNNMDYWRRQAVRLRKKGALATRPSAIAESLRIEPVTRE